MERYKTFSSVLTHNIESTKIIKKIGKIFPPIKLALTQCPVNEGLNGNKQADRLSKITAKNPIPNYHSEKPNFSSFQDPVKYWGNKEPYQNYPSQVVKGLV